jgi:chemotaxis signal transduction protein
MKAETDMDFGQNLEFAVDDGKLIFFVDKDELAVPIEKMDEVLKFVATIPEDLSAAVHLEGGLDIGMLPAVIGAEHLNLIVFTYHNQMLMLNISEFRGIVDKEADRIGLQRLKA